MAKQSVIYAKDVTTASALMASYKRYDMLTFIILFVLLLGITPVLALWGTSVGFSIIVGILVALMLAAALVRWPMLGLYLVAASAFMVEQEILPDTPVVTDRLYIFYWPPQLEGFIERPIGVLFLFTLFLWIFYQLVKRRPLLKGGALIGPFVFYIVCVFGAVGYGVATGGDIKIIILQFRPFWYMFLAYILAYNFVTRKSDVRNFFWVAIVSAGVKGLQGVYIYLILLHGDLSGHETIMSHEESFFFAALLLLVVIFCLHYRYRPQLIAALCISPLVLIALVANQRRTDYTALLLGIGVAWLLVFLLKPWARRALVILLIVSVTLGASYVLAFSHSNASYAAPARALMATFNPSADDVRNATSNLYRTYEDNDLKYTVKQYPLGLGFGKPFLQPQPLESIFPGIVNFDPYYNYVPHNTIYWIWVDMGPLGYLALWFLFGSIIIRGCIMVRKLKDPYLQVVAIYIVAVTVMEIIVAFADYQLFFYRNVIDLGLLCGLLVKLPILDEEQNEGREVKEVQKNGSTHGGSAPSLPIRGSKHPQLSSPQSIGS